MTRTPAAGGARHDAVRRLRALANDQRFAPAADDLKGLAHAVETEHFDGWDRIDLHAAFPPAAAIRIESAAGRETGLGVAAGAAVFLPIAWTWWSLREAAEAYQVMLQNGSAEGASFLQLWVSGFDGNLAPMHDLSTVTLVSVILIVVAIVLFVAHKVVADGRMRKVDLQYAEAEAQLASTLALARRAISQSLMADGQSVESLVNTSLQKLQESHEATRTSSEQLALVVTEAQQAISRSLAELQHVSSGLSGATTGLDKAATTVAQAATDASSGTAAALQSLQSELAAAAQRYQEENDVQLRQSRDAIVTAMAELQDHYRVFQDIHQRAFRQVDELAVHSDELKNEMATGVGRNVDAIADAVRALEANLPSLLSALQANQSAVQAQTTELTFAADALAILSRSQFTALQETAVAGVR